MAKGFDPKWSLVALLCSNRGVDGSSVIIPEKGATEMNVTGGVALSTACPAFVKGAAYFGNPVASQSLYPQNQSFDYQDQAYEIEFFPTGFGETGDRYLFSVSTILRVYFDIDDELLRVDFKNNGVEQNFSAPVDLNSLVGVVSKCIVRLTTGRLDVELNGTTLIDVAHGLTSFDVATGPILSIGNRAETGTNLTNFYGYIGQFRRTVGDSRQEESSAVIYDLEVLSALDTYREKVAFHSHFDGLEGATTTTELSSDRLISFTGSAALSTSSSQFGPSCISLAGGTAYCDGIDFSAQKFTIEFWEKRTENDGTNRYIFSIMDEAGVDHALSVSATYFGPVILRKDGADVATSGVTGPKIVWQHWAVVRDGTSLAVFVAGVRVILFNIGTSALVSNGRFVLGKGGSVAPAAASTDWIDECRITVGEARYNVAAETISPPAERFNEYGPHSMRGTVKRMVSGSAVISPGSLVAAFDRATLRLVSRDVSAADGSFELPSAHGDEHFVLAFDDDMNLVGYDKILPAIFS